MAKNKMGQSTKNKILQAAKEIFIEKGYDCAKVDEIAERAQVTKVMLYYHFESKENILKEIIAATLSEVGQKLRERLGTMKISDEEAVKSLFSEFIRIWIENKNILRLILIELLKDKSVNHDVLELMRHFYSDVISIFEDSGKKAAAKDEIYIRLLYFNTFPMVMHAVLSEDIAREYQTDSAQIDRIFNDHFIKSLYLSLEE